MRTTVSALVIWLVFSGAASAAQIETVRILQDGSVLIDGHRYTNTAPLRAKLDAIDSQKPPVELELRVGRDIPWNASMVGLKLLLKAGYKGKVGFLTVPKT